MMRVHFIVQYERHFGTCFKRTEYVKCVYVCASVCECVCVIAVTRQDVENSAVHVVRALERSTEGPQRGGMKERQKGGRGMRGRETERQINE